MSSIVWHSTSPWSPSGYGNQTAIWTRKLIEMGHEVVISSYWGLSGSPTEWNGIPVLPGYGHAYCSASLHQHAKALNPDIVITLGDIWVLDANLLRELPIAHWLPGDCRPMSTADRNVAEASGSQLIAMSKFGKDRFITAGFNPLYVPHGIDTELFTLGKDKAAIREKLGLGQDEFVIGVNAANNDAIRKAAPEMFLAFAKFHANHPDAILAIHAGVHQEGGQDLEVLAENCGVPVITTNASSMTELNPHGIGIDGTPFWNGVHKGWWIRPDLAGMADAFEEAYEKRDDVNREQLREFALEYSIENVAEKYMGPVIIELADRMAKRR